MRLDTVLRREALRRIALTALAVTAAPPAAAPAQEPGVASTFGTTAAELEGAMGGLKPGTGRPLNALIKMRAETGVERLQVDGSPLFKPGQILDSLRTASGGAAEVSFNFPEQWTLAGGPNLDVRDVRQSDSAFVLVAKAPAKPPFGQLPDEFFLDVLFDPLGKYGQYGQVDDRKVVSSSLVEVKLPAGGVQAYRRLSIKFAPLSYNQNTVERRALLSATSVGGSVFICVSGSLATRFKAVKDDLLDVQESFRVTGGAGASSAASAAAPVAVAAQEQNS